MSTASEPTGTLGAALSHANKLLNVDPELAAEQAREILKAAPEYDPARLVLAAACRLSGDPARALEIVVPLVVAQPGWVAAHFENAQALAAAGHGDEAINALQRTVGLKPDHPEAWRMLADHLMAIGDTKAADRAYARHIRCSTRDPVLQQSAAAMISNDVATAERLLKAHLAEAPTDVPAIRMLAEVAVRVGRDDEAVRLLKRCLELAPSFAAARFNYAVLLHRHNDSAAAISELEKLLETEPRNPSYRNLYAVALSRVGDYERSSSIYAELLGEYAGNAKIWLSYGHVLKTEGRQAESIDAYRKSIDLDPAFGEAYWSLANLKTFRFTEPDLAEMHNQLADPELSTDNRLHLNFALGKAYEDAGSYALSFEHYEQGNALHRSGHPYNADRNTTRAQRLKKVFTRQLFERRADFGCNRIRSSSSVCHAPARHCSSRSSLVTA